MLLTTAYFPPLSWFALAARDMTLSPDRVLPSVVQLEACENYQKQSYRNRCYILAGDGVQMLQVPVVHGGKAEGCPADAFARTGSRSDASAGHPSASAITRVRVDYSTPWVVRTERALLAAYETSAFFDYYKDSLFALLEAQPETLWELNRSLLEWCLERCGVACTLVPTTDFAPVERNAAGTCALDTPSENRQADDYRYAIHPKRPDDILASLGLNRPYYQVFQDRLGGFTPRLSILDLLFNEGPNSLLWLKRL